MPLIRIIRNRLYQSKDLQKRHSSYSRLTSRQNITRPYLIISFDCDTPQDVAASLEFIPWFIERNIKAVFAVPGTRLEASSADFKNIFQMGFEFMNHGYLEHAAYDNDKKAYYSITWYHEMHPDEILQDILNGHRAVLETTGLSPKGFRAPHFGHLTKKDLDTVYSTIISLGYTYSTTTVPQLGLDHGAVYEPIPGLFEFPLTGTYDNPNILLDSWQFLAAPKRIYSADDYMVQFRKLVDYYGGRHLPCILNLYVDPCHVLNFPGFFQCLDYAIEKEIAITTYSDILSSLNPA